MGTKFIAEVHDVLDQFGFEDITTRTQTDECPAPVPWLRSEFELVVDRLEHQDWTVGGQPPDSVSRERPPGQ